MNNSISKQNYKNIFQILIYTALIIYLYISIFTDIAYDRRQIGFYLENSYQRSFIWSNLSSFISYVLPSALATPFFYGINSLVLSFLIILFVKENIYKSSFLNFIFTFYCINSYGLGQLRYGTAILLCFIIRIYIKRKFPNFKIPLTVASIIASSFHILTLFLIPFELLEIFFKSKYRKYGLVLFPLSFYFIWINQNSILITLLNLTRYAAYSGWVYSEYTTLTFLKYLALIIVIFPLRYAKTSDNLSIFLTIVFLILLSFNYFAGRAFGLFFFIILPIYLSNRIYITNISKLIIASCMLYEIYIIYKTGIFFY